MFVQVLVRLVLYADQWLTRRELDNAISSVAQHSSIEQTPVLCESFYVLLEYARTAVFVWMFLEGVHLHTSIVVVFPRKMNYPVFHVIGWGVPLFLVTIWTLVMVKYYYHTLCWWGYPFSAYYWILEGPRMCIILINLVILLNIVCVVVMKLQETNSNEFQQLRKAVRAALLLLPLLGIPSILDAVPVPVESSPLRFAIWSYSTHTLSSLQGFFIALLYCFLNREVRNVVSKHWLSFRIARRPLQNHCCVAVDSGGRRSAALMNGYKNNSTIEEPAQLKAGGNSPATTPRLGETEKDANDQSSPAPLHVFVNEMPSPAPASTSPPQHIEPTATSQASSNVARPSRPSDAPAAHSNGIVRHKQCSVTKEPCSSTVSKQNGSSSQGPAISRPVPQCPAAQLSKKNIYHFRRQHHYRNHFSNIADDDAADGSYGDVPLIVQQVNGTLRTTT